MPPQMRDAKGKKRKAEEVSGPSQKKQLSELKFPTEEKTFQEWFWKSSNGNDMVKKLNAYAQEEGLDDRIHREKESPVKGKIDKKMVEVKQSGERDVIEVFKDIQFTTVPPKKYQNEWFDQD